MELIQPGMLVAIECEPEPVDALETYLTRAGLREACHTYYGVDQADRGSAPG
jgi:hypothetical protein